MSYPPASLDIHRACGKGNFPRLYALLVASLPGALLLSATSAHAQTATPPAATTPAAASPTPAPNAKMDDGMHEMATDSRMKGLSQQQQMDMIEFVVGNMLFVGFHELGHGVIHELGLPVLGKEEDAADSFATIAMINMNTDFSNRVLVQAARGWFLMDRRDRKQGDMLAFYDEHGLDKQRAYQIVCFMVGWNEDRFKELADWVKMPAARQDSCAGDYSNAEFSWNAELKPFRRAPDQPKSKIDVDYGEAKGKLEVYARTLRSIGYLETIAGYAAELIVWPRPISIVLQTCGDSNAEWNPAAHKEQLCYELAEDFLELYRGYTDAAKVGGVTMNELIARNIRRLRSQHSMSQQGLASGTGMDQNWIKRMENGEENATVAQLNQLAKALRVETTELFKREAAEAQPEQTSATQAPATQAPAAAQTPVAQTSSAKAKRRSRN
jgi:transcriptional regulator with XRE-family HTH domain